MLKAEYLHRRMERSEHHTMAVTPRKATPAKPAEPHSMVESRTAGQLIQIVLLTMHHNEDRKLNFGNRQGRGQGRRRPDCTLSSYAITTSSSVARCEEAEILLEQVLAVRAVDAMPGIAANFRYASSRFQGISTPLRRVSVVFQLSSPADLHIIGSSDSL